MYCQHESAGVDFDGNVNYGAEGNFAGIEAFDETVAVPAVPDHRSQTTSHLKVHTVYKKAPGAPKRFKSSYVHFFTNFVEKKKQQLGPDGLVSVVVVAYCFFPFEDDANSQF